MCSVVDLLLYYVIHGSCFLAGVRLVSFAAVCRRCTNRVTRVVVYVLVDEIARTENYNQCQFNRPLLFSYIQRK